MVHLAAKIFGEEKPTAQLVTMPLKVNNKQFSQQEVGQLVEEYQPRLKAFVRKHVDNIEDADDILQDVFYQLVKTVEDALNPIEHVSGWLYRVAKNTIINKGKKKKEEKLPTFKDKDSDSDILKDFSDILFSKETSPSPEMEYLRSLVWTELERALSELPAEQREIFELTELDGLPVKEISQSTGVPVNTLLSRKHYAVVHLRKRMAYLYHEIIYS
jgi:RNA polymerase sigma factor (sigma-70 family)